MSYIFLHRKILNWEWYSDANTFRLFMHLLLNVSYEQNRWQGINIQPGKLITGRKKLAEQLKLSEQEIRTSLSKLKSTSEITIKATNKFSVITICKWADYQDKTKVKKPANKPAEHQTGNQQSTTTKEYKEYKESKEEKNNISVNFSAQFDEFRKLYPGTKRGNQTEFDFFLDKHKDWKKILPLLKPAILSQIKIRTEKEKRGDFVPSWKNLKTWINQKCWEEEEIKINGSATTKTVKPIPKNSEPDIFDELTQQRLTAISQQK
jgi:hypothetical protein